MAMKCEYCGCEMELEMEKSYYGDDDFEYVCTNPDCVVNEV